MGKKKFIDKKTAHHFFLVHRSQRDPLIVDENSSPLVLVPSNKQKIEGKPLFQLRDDPNLDYGTRRKKNEEEDEEDGDGDDDDFEDEDGDEDEDEDEKALNLEKQKEDSGDNQKKLKEVERESEKVKENEKRDLEKVRKPQHENFGESAKYGIYFDDTEYDYTKHLKEMGTPGGIFIPAFLRNDKADKRTEVVFRNDLNLPEEVLPSRYEEGIALPNRVAMLSGPQPGLGDDVIEALEALDDDEYQDEQFYDDFLDKANEDVESEENEDGDDDDYSQSYDSDNLDEKFETRSKFTDYSMTSSSMTRTKELQMLDDRFDRMMNEYDDDQIGELQKDDPSLQGLQSIEQFEDVLDEFLEDTEKVPALVAITQNFEKMGITKDVILKRYDASTDEDEENEVIQVDLKPEEQWDCESVLSTYTNHENHPAMIKEIRKNKIKLGKNGIPLGVLQNKKEPRNKEDLTSEEEEEEEEEEEKSDEETENLGQKRSKNETPEQRKERKKAAQELKKARREQKKTTKLAFKNEKLKQEKSVSSNSRKGMISL